ncbi:unnamed protein product, partial [Adineta steineri]
FMMLLALQGYKQQVSDTLQALKTNLEQLKILQKIKQNNHSTQQRRHRTASHEFSRTNQNVYLNHLVQMSQPSHRAASNQFGSTDQNLRLNYPIVMSQIRVTVIRLKTNFRLLKYPKKNAGNVQSYKNSLDQTRNLQYTTIDIDKAIRVQNDFIELAIETLIGINEEMDIRWPSI